MTEHEMENLIAAHPKEFFPRKDMVLKGRQESFSGVGRFDLLFEDEHHTNVLMELKAVPAKYEHASQLAKYKTALEEKGNRNIVMWLVAPLIPTPVRDFLDHIGIEYTEIHEAEYRAVAGRYGLTTEGSLVRDIPTKAEWNLSGASRPAALPAANQSSLPIDIAGGTDNGWKKHNRFIREHTNTIFRQTSDLLNGAEVYFTLSGKNWRSSEGSKDALVYLSQSSNTLVVIPRRAVDTYIFDLLFEKTPKGYYLIRKYKQFAIDDSDRISLKFESKLDRLEVILKAFVRYNVDPIPLMSLPRAYWPEIGPAKIDSPSKLVEEIRCLCQELASGEGIAPVNE